MAGSADPRADAFDADEFRDAIRFAMKMGSPNAVEAKVTFQWTPKQTFDPQSPDKKPYNWTQAPVTNVTHPDVVIDEAAVEMTEPRLGGVAGTPVGQFDQVRAKVVLLDIDFERIDGLAEPPNLPDHVLIGGDRFEIRFINSRALFDVDIYEIHTVAADVK